jgi:hypothetical protein
MGEWRYTSIVLDLGIKWGYVVIYMPRSLYRGETAPNIHWIGGWVGPRTGLDAVKKRKISLLLGIEPRPSNP